MRGTSWEELVEWLSHGHEVEFIYRETPYVIQPEEDNGKAFLVIWRLGDSAVCICKQDVPMHGDIPLECIDTVLCEKCFDGKSFREIEQDAEVTSIL